MGVFFINPVKHSNVLHELFVRRHVSTFIKLSLGLFKRRDPRPDDDFIKVETFRLTNNLYNKMFFDWIYTLYDLDKYFGMTNVQLEKQSWRIHCIL
jgi:hypothetical protein